MLLFSEDPCVDRTYKWDLGVDVMIWFLHL